VLVPRSSGTLVATWAWPIWVVSRRRVLEVVLVLLESPYPSRRIFIGAHSLPPLWFSVSVLQYTTIMHIFYTNKVARVVLQFLWTGTHLGGKWNQRSRQARHGRTTRHDRPCRCGRPGSCGRPCRCGRTCPKPHPWSQSSPSPCAQLG
jgi:hypothetical protein